MNNDSSVEEDDCIAVWCAGDNWCAITCTMELINNKWHPVIIDRLLDRGPLRFNQILDEIDGITNKVLSESLDDLEENGLVNRRIVDEKPVQVEYMLTDRGRSLEPVIRALEDWGTKHLRPAANEASSCGS